MCTLYLQMIFHKTCYFYFREKYALLQEKKERERKLKEFQDETFEFERKKMKFECEKMEFERKMMREKEDLSKIKKSNIFDIDLLDESNSGDE